MDHCRWIVEIVLRRQQTQGFVVLKKRWVVERTFGWLMGCRRLVRDYELLPETERDVNLPSHDPYYGEAFGIIFDLSELLKHPLTNINLISPKYVTILTHRKSFRIALDI